MPSRRVKKRRQPSRSRSGSKRELRYSRSKSLRKRSTHLMANCPGGEILQLFTKRVGCGTFGCTYEATPETQAAVRREFGRDDVLLKIIFDTEGEEPPSQQFRLAKRMDELGVGPAVLTDKLIKCRDLRTREWRWAYVIQRLGLSASNYLRSVGRERGKADLHALWPKIKARYERMNDAGWTHNDIHYGNVLVKVNGAGLAVDAFLIDFDRAERYTRKTDPKFVRQSDEDWQALYDMFKV